MLRRILLWLLGDSVVRREELDWMLYRMKEVEVYLPDGFLISPVAELVRDINNTLAKHRVFGTGDFTGPTTLSVLRRDIDALYSHLGLSWEDVPAERRLVKGKK